MAFGKVSREMMCEKLEKLWMKGKMLAMIKAIFRVTVNEVITKQGISGKFRTSKRVRQGCPLSPILFCLTLDDIDDIYEHIKVGGTVMRRGIKVFCLKFADDNAVIK